MRLRLVEQVRLRKVPAPNILSSRKVWSGDTPYQLFVELTLYETGEKKRRDIFSCKLKLAEDKTADEISYWYVMQKADRQLADTKLKKRLSELDAEGWDVTEVANEAKALFDQPKKFWAFSASHDKKLITKQAEEKDLNNVLQDVSLQRSA
jgi:hypothetical protein